MFIKIIRGNAGDHESVYECTAYHVSHHDATGDLTISMEGAAPCGDAVSVTLPKDPPEALQAYVMNSKGETVDTIRFAKD